MELLQIEQAAIDELSNNPYQSLTIDIGGNKATVQIALPDYGQRLKDFYGASLMPNFESTLNRSGIAYNGKHFGLIIRFEQPTILHMHNSEMELLGDSKALIGKFEVVMMLNAAVDKPSRNIGHRNRFPHLNFHRDRNEHQPTPYSLYTRDPQDPEQCHPRTSSTLFATNLVGYLQCMRERNYAHLKNKGVQPHYNIFHDEDMSKVLGNIVLEQRWDEPEGIGEISMLDNRTTLHASYLRNIHKHGYRIGVRYLC